MNPWTDLGAMCLAGARNEALHARCHAVGCDCPCHADEPAEEHTAPEPETLYRDVPLAAGSAFDALVFPLPCPHCGGQLEHVAEGRTTDRMAVLQSRCSHCRATWAARLEVAAMTPPRAESSPATRHVDESRRGPTADIAQPSRPRKWVRELATDRRWVLVDDSDPDLVTVRPSGYRSRSTWREFARDEVEIEQEMEEVGA